MYNTSAFDQCINIFLDILDMNTCALLSNQETNGDIAFRRFRVCHNLAAKYFQLREHWTEESVTLDF